MISHLHIILGDYFMEDSSNLTCYFVKDIEPYKEEKVKATQHVASVIKKSVEETSILIEAGMVMFWINKDTEETWFEVVGENRID